MAGARPAQWPTQSSSLPNESVLLEFSQLGIEEELASATGNQNTSEKPRVVKQEPSLYDLGDSEPSGKIHEAEAMRHPSLDKYIQSSLPQRVTDPDVTNISGRSGVQCDPPGNLSSLTVTPPFILKLCSMVSTKEFEHLVSWGSVQETVLVKDLKRFSTEVLPKYFKHKNFTSFLRQLNMYGFYTLHQGDNWREFKNELFKKDGSHDYVKIKRKTTQNISGLVNSSFPYHQKSLKATKPKKAVDVVTKDNSSSIKETRKRKKDVFKGKNPKEIESAVELINEQQELIRQLARKCEVSEAKIESLEDSVAFLRESMKQIREDLGKSSMPLNSHSQSTESSKKRVPRHLSPQMKPVPAEIESTSFDFDPGCMSEVANDLLNSHPPELRGRTLSDTFLSVGTFNSPSMAPFPPQPSQNMNVTETDRFGLERTGYAHKSFDDISLLSSRDFFNKHWNQAYCNQHFHHQGRPMRVKNNGKKAKQKTSRGPKITKKTLTAEHQTTNENIKTVVQAKVKRKKKLIRLGEEKS